MHGVLDGLPFGKPGIGLDIEGAVQQPPHFLHSIFFYYKDKKR
jgi:hypothetical protein